ncbi:hypothetical protein AALB47_07475 [Lachnospiraceae bacterium 54-11]
MKDNRLIDFRFAPERPQSCIGLVDDIYKTILREDGSLNFGFDASRKLSFYAQNDDGRHPVRDRAAANYGFRFRYKPVITYRDKLIKVSQDFGNPAAAIVTTTEEYEKSVVSWKAFAWVSPSGARTDVLLWRLEAKEKFSTTRATVVLEEIGFPCDGSFEVKAVPGAKTRAIPGVKPYHFAAGEQKEGVFFIVQKGSLSEKELTLESGKEALNWAENYWEQVKPFTKNMNIPDSQIMDMLKACGRNILQARELHEKVYTYQVGPTDYRGLWFVDGHFILESVHMMGRSGEAYAGLLSVLANVHPDGSIQIMSHHDKETGIALATVARQCELMEDDERFKELWPTLCRGLNYIKEQRREAGALGKTYEGYELFPPCMGDGGINMEPEYTTPLWVMHGLKAVYETGERLGLPGYEEFRKEFDSIMIAFRKAAKRDTRKTKEGIPYVPMSMLSPREVEKRADANEESDVNHNREIYKPQTGIWAYSQAIYPGEIFSPDDELVKNHLALLESVDDKEGIPENTGWMCQDAVWGYGSMFDALAWLYTGRGDKAADYLYAFANHAAPARCWREEQSLKGTNSDEMTGDMPHNWGSAMFIYVTRNMLLMEKGGNLELFAGLPEEWLPDEKTPLILEETPVRYGKVTLKLEKQEEGKYGLTYQLNGCRTPNTLLLHWDGAVESAVCKNLMNGCFEIKGDVTSFQAVLRR